MKFAFNEVRNVVSDMCYYSEGKPLVWFELIWSLMNKNKMNIYNTIPEKILIYCRIYGMCLVYLKFCDIINGSNGDVGDIDLNIDFASLHTDFMDEDEEEIVNQYIQSIIINEDNTLEIFNLLSKELNVSTAFSSLYYSVYYEDFSLQDWETDEFYYGDAPDYYDEDYEFRKKYAKCEDVNLIYDEILNNVDTDKLVGFSWLEENM